MKWHKLHKESDEQVNLKKLLKMNGVTKLPSGTEFKLDRISWSKDGGYAGQKTLEKICGYKVTGMAYPGGRCDRHIAEIISLNTPIKYARTVTSTYNFDLQSDLLLFNPTVYYIEVEKLFELAEKFIILKADKPQLFYVWGHAFEMDAEYISWERFEEFCKLISGKEDIFYGTNSECLL